MIAHGVPGIDIRQTHLLQASPQAVFAALTRGLDGWWPLSLRLTGAGTRMTLLPELGADMIEAAPGGSTAAIWGRVDLIDPGARLYLNGWFGVPGAVMGRVHYDLAPDAQGTRLLLTHQAIGPVSEDRVTLQRGLWREALGQALPRHLQGTPA